MPFEDGQCKKKVKITDYFKHRDLGPDRSPQLSNNKTTDHSPQEQIKRKALTFEIRHLDQRVVEEKPSADLLEERMSVDQEPAVGSCFVKLCDVLVEGNLCDLSAEPNTYVLYRQPWVKGQVPRALSEEDDFSNATNYVRLPCREDITLEYENRPVNKWQLIRKLLGESIENLFQLERAIKTYNPYIRHFEFDILRSYINYQLTDEERQYFFEQLLPSITRLALDLPKAITCNLPLLEQGTTTALFLSQYQISCLLANAFLCTFTSRFKDDTRCINFVKLFSTNRSERRKGCKLEKLKCLLNYFRRVTKATPTGTVNFERKHLSSTMPVLEESTNKISQFEINSQLCMFESGIDYSVVDFANKFVGGGVLNSGCVQEEILFVICPELIVAKLFAERMWEKDALVITGAEQFNLHSGYGDDFKWRSSFDDSLARDKYGRKLRQVIAMNATAFRNPKVQYDQLKIDCEITKALSAFQGEKFLQDQSRLPAIATGNWGCGVFCGDAYLKTLIQIIAASLMKRNLVYFAFDNVQLKKDFDRINSLLLSKPHLTVGQLYRATLEFAGHRANQADYNLVRFLSEKLF